MRRIRPGPLPRRLLQFYLLILNGCSRAVRNGGAAKEAEAGREMPPAR